MVHMSTLKSSEVICYGLCDKHRNVSRDGLIVQGYQFYLFYLDYCGSTIGEF